MASEFFRALIGEDITAIFGLSPDAMWVLIALLLSISLGINVAVLTKNNHLGTGFILLAILFTTFLGMIDFVVIIVPLIIGTGLFLWFRFKGADG